MAIEQPSSSVQSPHPPKVHPDLLSLEVGLLDDELVGDTACARLQDAAARLMHVSMCLQTVARLNRPVEPQDHEIALLARMANSIVLRLYNGIEGLVHDLGAKPLEIGADFAALAGKVRRSKRRSASRGAYKRRP